ncbi:MAG: CopG family transcriptional regulator [Clostridiales bacterium]|nr:CopG family transcriptional regulator [Clostridiales bacterium]
MPQNKKEYKMLNCKIDKPIADELDKFIAETGLTKTATVEKALKMYISQFKETGKI